MLEVMDIYKTVLLKNKNISTAAFLIHLNNALRIINSRYGIFGKKKRKEVEAKSINDVLSLSEALVSPLASYILAHTLGNEEYALYMNEFTAYSGDAATDTGKSKIRKIHASPFTRS